MSAGSELHLLIIWSNAYSQRDRIIETLSSVGQKPYRLYEINWSDELFSENMSRFYGEHLPRGTFKEEHCGRGPFTLAVFECESLYGERNTARGREVVNTKMFDMKAEFRNWTGGGHKIHATNNTTETAHDLMLLLGLTIREFYEEVCNDGHERGTWSRISRDLEGSRGWRSLGHLFRVLNHTDNYVVLRNFETLPALPVGHDDVDLLVQSIDETVHITNAKKVFPEEYRVHYMVSVGGRDIPFDFRYVGDSYMPDEMSEDILETRIKDKKLGFFRPDFPQYFYSLLYHGLIHKPALSDEYRERLAALRGPACLNGLELNDGESAKTILDLWMAGRNMTYNRPTDLSVFYNG